MLRIWICAAALLYAGLALAQNHEYVDNLTHTTVGKTRPVLYGAVGQDGTLRPGDGWVTNNEPMYVVFQTDGYMDDRSSEIKYFTFYLRPMDQGQLEDVTVHTGAYLYWDNLETELPVMEKSVLAVITAEEQQAYFDKYPCQDERYFTHLSRACDYMPITLPIGLPPQADFIEDAGLYWRTYLISVEGVGAGYSLLDKYDSQQVVRNGLGLSMAPLGRLSTSPEATCQGYFANIVGSKDDEILRGTDEADVIVAMGENNIIYGMGGDDIICIVEGGGLADGGPGNDEIYNLGGKSMVLIGAEGDDFIQDGKGASSLIGGPGSDILRGGKGNDTLRGLSGNDRLYGDEGQDVCDGGKNSDKLDKSCEVKKN